MFSFLSVVPGLLDFNEPVTLRLFCRGLPLLLPLPRLAASPLPASSRELKDDTIVRKLIENYEQCFDLETGPRTAVITTSFSLCDCGTTKRYGHNFQNSQTLIHHLFAFEPFLDLLDFATWRVKKITYEIRKQNT